MQTNFFSNQLAAATTRWFSFVLTLGVTIGSVNANESDDRPLKPVSQRFAEVTDEAVGEEGGLVKDLETETVLFEDAA